MAEDRYPNVYVVDSHVTRPPIPPKVNQRPSRAGAAQTLLFVLVGLALCGMAIEACFIYRLYQPQAVSMSFHSVLAPPCNTLKIYYHITLTVVFWFHYFCLLMHFHLTFPMKPHSFSSYTSFSLSVFFSSLRFSSFLLLIFSFFTLNLKLFDRGKSWGILVFSATSWFSFKGQIIVSQGRLPVFLAYVVVSLGKTLNHNHGETLVCQATECLCSQCVWANRWMRSRVKCFE